MFQTLKEGLKRAQIRVRKFSKLNRKLLKLSQKKFKKAYIIALAVKLALITVPTLTVPAVVYGASSGAEISVAQVSIGLSKNDAVFSGGQKSISVTPGDSNQTITDKAESAKVKVAIVKPKVTVVLQNTNPSIDWLRGLYLEAGSAYGVPSQLLEAIHQVESGKSGDTARVSSAGAMGPMQFLPSTFRKYSSSGGSITSVHDSVFAAAKLLSAAKGDGDSWDRAILSYNHSASYLRMVKNMANELGANI